MKRELILLSVSSAIDTENIIYNKGSIYTADKGRPAKDDNSKSVQGLTAAVFTGVKIIAMTLMMYLSHLPRIHVLSTVCDELRCTQNAPKVPNHQEFL